MDQNTINFKIQRRAPQLQHYAECKSSRVKHSLARDLSLHVQTCRQGVRRTRGVLCLAKNAEEYVPTCHILYTVYLQIGEETQ